MLTLLRMMQTVNGHSSDDWWLCAKLHDLYFFTLFSRIIFLCLLHVITASPKWSARNFLRLEWNDLFGTMTSQLHRNTAAIVVLFALYEVGDMFKIKHV